ncbi:methyltransferase domain-containing protein [Aspergillus cavernicola]|uniref:Protein-lysine N-methyltransferase EFM4 n=1 Tax=Aspergillus cavernicola TaxID=176166 RepID=A0ABR4HVB7_9EURO
MAQTSDAGHPIHLSPSELGTKEYWETFYSRTLTHISSKHNPSTPGGPNPNSGRNSDDPDHAAGLDDDNASEEDDDDEDDYNADSDPGTSWFSEHNAPQKVLGFLTREGFPLAPCNTLPSTSARRRRARAMKKLSEQERHSQPSVLDLGTGNGSMLALLRKRGRFWGDMVGVDYSAKSVELARELQESKRHEAYQSDSDSDESDLGSETGAQDGAGGGQAEELEEWEDIRFEEWDILRSGDDLRAKKLDWFPYEKGGFDIVLDKGTFDAVSLMAEKSECERYPGIAGSLVRKGGFFVVTSCNWTEEEIVRWFTTSTSTTSTGDTVSEAAKLVVWGRVQYPRFRFGGQEGQGVCTVCFQRV